MAADGCGLLILALANGFHDGFRAVFLSGWRRIAHSIIDLNISKSLVNGLHDGFRAVFLCGWRRIAHSFSRQRLSRRFACRIAQRIAAHCSYFRSSKPFMTDCAPFCSAGGSALLILQFVKGFHDGLRAVLLSGLQRIAHTSARQRLSQRFARRIAQRMAADCSFFRSSTGFTTICTLYCSANSSADGVESDERVYCLSKAEASRERRI